MDYLNVNGFVKPASRKIRIGATTAFSRRFGNRFLAGAAL
jgi:hypothetical protein